MHSGISLHLGFKFIRVNSPICIELHIGAQVIDRGQSQGGEI